MAGAGPAGGVRERAERHAGSRVARLVWSARVDLLALANDKGEVQVHRLTWQKVWSLPPPRETSTVCDIAWRPDGKALAIGYNCGRVYIVDVEDKEILHSFTVGEDSVSNEEIAVSCVSWGVRAGKLHNTSQYNVYDDASIFLPTPPPLNTGYKNKKSEDSISDFKQLQQQNQLNILVVAYGNGNVHLSVFGRFPCGVINLQQLTNGQYGEIKVVDAQLSEDFSVIQLFYIEKANNRLHFAIVQTAVLSVYSEELFAMASKHNHIMHFLSYIDQTMTSMTEAWEHILLEMYSKIADYASRVPEGGVSADFLELLMMGTASDELEPFLLRELTAKGLKKFGSSVELSYSTIQKLVVNQLNIVGQSLLFYLAELRGLARIPDRYEVLGLEEEPITNAIRVSVGFLNKCLELQQVIDLSMRNYKAFFRWLFVVIVRLLDEQTLGEIVKITQQELGYIAEFLYNFDSVEKENADTPKKPIRFNLQRLAQYLQNEELTILPDDDDNPWQKFLSENKCLVNESETIISMTKFRKYSLVQQQGFLRQAITNVFEFTEVIIGNNYSLLHNILCHGEPTFGSMPNDYRSSQIFQSGNKSYIAFAHQQSNRDQVIFVSLVPETNSLQMKGAMFYFSPSDLNFTRYDTLDRNMIVCDLQFYSTDILSILLQHPYNDEVSAFVQFPIRSAIEHCSIITQEQFNTNLMECLPRVEGSALLEPGVFKVLDKMAGYRLAVSSGRKVAVVLSTSCRKVRIYDTEAEGDDDSDVSQGTPMGDNSGIEANETI